MVESASYLQRARICWVSVLRIHVEAELGSHFERLLVTTEELCAGRGGREAKA